jgi:hypothetical protein
MGLQMKYFVLKPKGTDAFARASRRAMLAYADTVECEDKDLAQQLRRWVNVEHLLALPPEAIQGLGEGLMDGEGRRGC